LNFKKTCVLVFSYVNSGYLISKLCDLPIHSNAVSTLRTVIKAVVQISQQRQISYKPTQETSGHPKH